MKNLISILCVCLLNLTLGFGQTTISGAVSDDEGIPLPGASIIEEGTSNGTITDFDGNFTLQIGDDSSIVISYVGYENLILQSDADFSQIALIQSNALEEVVVTSFGLTREKKSIGYSQQSVGGEQLVKARETDIGKALAG